MQILIRRSNGAAATLSLAKKGQRMQRTPGSAGAAGCAVACRFAQRGAIIFPIYGLAVVLVTVAFVLPVLFGRIWGWN